MDFRIKNISLLRFQNNVEDFFLNIIKEVNEIKISGI